MDLKQLEYFMHVAELGGFTRAAAVLRVAQPALSRQVRALELELRQPLLQRNGRGVTLTEGGKRLLEHARGILQQVQRARLDLEDQRGAATGRITLALPPTLSRTFTSPLVRAFRERFPKASLSVMEGLSAYALEWLAIGRVDCAVVYNAPAAASIDLMPLMHERLYLVGRRPKGRQRLVGPTVALAELARRELAMPSKPHAIRMLVESRLAAEGLKPQVVLEIESIPALLDLAAQGGLHAVLSLNALRGSQQEAALQAQPVGAEGAEPLTSSLWLATSSQRPRGVLMERCMALVRELLEEHLA